MHLISEAKMILNKNYKLLLKQNDNPSKSLNVKY